MHFLILQNFVESPEKSLSLLRPKITLYTSLSYTIRTEHNIVWKSIWQPSEVSMQSTLILNTVYSHEPCTITFDYNIIVMGKIFSLLPGIHLFHLAAA